MRIPIAIGTYTDEAANYRTFYPRNMIPVPKNTGISEGYLRPHDGISTLTADGPGASRGSINWNGVNYRVMGSKLISVSSSGVITEIGDVGGSSSHVPMDYSFTHLALISDGNFWLYDGNTLAQNTDPDLGQVIDMIYVDGYWMLTDGQYLIVTDIGDPFSVNPLKYGSSEVDPDPIQGLLKIRNETYAINRNTIEVLQNTGGSNFPFQRVEGTRIDRGSIGSHCKCWYLGTVAFLGGARNESPAVWLGLNADSNKISTREIDQILQDYTEAELSQAVFEARVDKNHRHLWIRLPDKTLVFDSEATHISQRPIWFILTTSITGDAQFQAQNLTWVYDKWLVGNASGSVGYLNDKLSTHWEETTGWEFATQILYNDGSAAIIHELELVGLPGRVALGLDPVIWTSFSEDGETWSQEFSISAGTRGQRNRRLVWFRQGVFRHWRIQKFRGTSDAFLSFSRLEARMEGLN
jgi:Phage stabilisation protein